MDEIELVQVDCKTEEESSSDEEVHYLLAEPSLLEDKNGEKIVISDEEITEKQENFDADVVDLDFKTETTQQLPLIQNASKYSNFKEDVEELDYPNKTTNKGKEIKKMPGLRSIAQDSQHCQEQCFKYSAQFLATGRPDRTLNSLRAQPSPENK